MSPATVGIIGIVVLVALFLLRMPVAFAMALVGFVGFAFLTGPEAALNLLGIDIYDQFSSYPLSVIPMFILMGTFAFASGISRRLYRTAYAWIGHRRGGLTVATVFACAGFGAICGSSTATAATMGKIALPEMKKYKYDDTLATGTVAAAGTLGILIPPSTVLIVYGILTEQSIGKLFVAGILPGILLSILFAATVVYLCWRKPAIGPPGIPSSLREKFKALTGIIEALLLFILAIGGVFSRLVQPHPGWRHRRRWCLAHRPGAPPAELADIYRSRQGRPGNSLYGDIHYYRGGHLRSFYGGIANTLHAG